MPLPAPHDGGAQARDAARPRRSDDESRRANQQV